MKLRVTSRIDTGSERLFRVRVSDGIPRFSPGRREMRHSASWSLATAYQFLHRFYESSMVGAFHAHLFRLQLRPRLVAIKLMSACYSEAFDSISTEKSDAHMTAVTEAHLLEFSISPAKPVDPKRSGDADSSDAATGISAASGFESGRQYVRCSDQSSSTFQYLPAVMDEPCFRDRIVPPDQFLVTRLGPG